MNAGASAHSDAPLDYGESANWIINEKYSSPDGAGRAYDLFYIYPTLVSNRDKPLMDLSDPGVELKTLGFVTAQVELFCGSRQFAPFVRQLEYRRSMDYLHGDADLEKYMRVGAADAVAAFRHYMKHWNNGRPYVLFGHSQGSVNLYEVMRECHGISAGSGFVAAYLLGMPNMTEARILRDFASRGIKPAMRSDDVAVIVGWNTQSDDAENPIYSTPGGYVINPLNWRTDETPATAWDNIGSVFYHYHEINPRLRHERKKNLCGAVVDKARGVLVVDLPSNAYWDAHGFVGKGVFHMNDFWFFAENLIANVDVRLAAWHDAHPQSC